MPEGREDHFVRANQPPTLLLDLAIMHPTDQPHRCRWQSPRPRRTCAYPSICAYRREITHIRELVRQRRLNSLNRGLQFFLWSFHAPRERSLEVPSVVASEVASRCSHSHPIGAVLQAAATRAHCLRAEGLQLGEGHRRCPIAGRNLATIAPGRDVPSRRQVFRRGRSCALKRRCREGRS
jgi:hypothetical protein